MGSRHHPGLFGLDKGDQFAEGSGNPRPGRKFYWAVESGQKKTGVQENCLLRGLEERPWARGQDGLIVGSSIGQSGRNGQRLGSGVFPLKEKEPSPRQNSPAGGWVPWEEEECLSSGVQGGIPALDRRLGPALKCPSHAAPMARILWLSCSAQG